MLFALEVDGRYAFGSCFCGCHDTFSGRFFLAAAHDEGVLAAEVALVAGLGLGLIAGFGKLAFRLFLVLEEQGILFILEEGRSHRVDGLVGFHFFGDVGLDAAFLFLFLFGGLVLAQFLLEYLFFFAGASDYSFGLVDQGVEAVLHPSVALVAVHSCWAFRGLNRLYFIEEVPVRTLLGFVVVEGGFSSVVLDVVGVGTVSAVVAACRRRYSWV